MSALTAPRTILVVDDETNLRQTLALILKKAGYAVTTAGNGAEARRDLESNDYNLIFLDLKMPDVDGITLLNEIRRSHPRTSVLILTAHATLDSAIEAVRLGARDYLLKPIDPEKILSRVSEIIAEAEEQSRRRELMGELQGLISEITQLEQQPTKPPAPPEPPQVDPNRYLQRGPFILDLHVRHIAVGQKSISLSPTAFNYLVTLLRHAPDPVSYEVLVQESQGYKPTLMEARDMARWRIHELRKAIEADSRQPQYIITVRDVGYRLVP